MTTTPIMHISYKGESLPVRISISALIGIMKDTGKTMEELNLQDPNNVSYWCDALWYGLLSGHEAENKEMKLTRDKMPYILDESFAEFNEIMKVHNPPVQENVVDGSEDKKK